MAKQGSIGRRLLIVLSILLASPGCRQFPDHSRLVHSLFLDRGFFFVWETNFADGHVSESLKLPHAVNSQGTPAVIEKNRAYIFHPIGSRDIEALGEHELPSWIRECGCSVINAPSASAGGFIHPYVGGTEFIVSFDCGAERYRIEARNDPYLGAARRGDPSVALVLIREK